MCLPYTPFPKDTSGAFHTGTKINRVDPALSSQRSVRSVGESVWLVFVPFLTKPAAVWLSEATKSDGDQCYTGNGSRVRGTMRGGVGQNCFRRIVREGLSDLVASEQTSGRSKGVSP